MLVWWVVFVWYKIFIEKIYVMMIIKIYNKKVVGWILEYVVCYMNI